MDGHLMTPYDDLNFGPGGDYEALAARFPALASFIPFNETVDGTFTDVITGMSHTDAANVIYDSTYKGLSCNITAGTQPTVGAVPAPGAKDILLIGLGVASAARAQTLISCGFGATSGVIQRAIMASSVSGASFSSFHDGSTSTQATLATALVQDTHIIQALAIKRGVPMEARRVNSDEATIVSANSGATNCPATNITAFPNSSSVETGIRFFGVFCGFAALYFANGLPADWKVGAYWTGKQWLRETLSGRKYKGIYPGWIGRT